MNHFVAGILRIILLEASVATLVIARLLGDRPDPRSRRIVTFAFCALASLSFFGWMNFQPMRGLPVHHWEQFHFYLGAKYPTEVGYEDLYKAAILADRETVRILGALEHTRDLTNFELLPVASIEADLPRVRARFSPERWEAFKQDWTALVQRPANWRLILQDHGNSNSPAWAVFAHPIASLLPVTDATQKLMASIDLLLMLAMFAFVFRTFGARAGCVALAVWSMMPACHDYLLGSFLRWDWLFALGMATCFLARNRPATAGAFFGYAVASKLFPLFFGVALLARAAQQWVRARKLERRYLRFGAGAIAALALFVAISSAMFGGPAIWASYKQRIDVARKEKFYANQYSLQTVFLQVAASAPAELAQGWFAPAEIKQARPDVNLADHRGTFLWVQLLATALVLTAALRAHDDVSAFTLGPLLVYTWLIVNMYYWNMLGLMAMAWFLRRDLASLLALVGVHAILVLFYLYQHLNRGYAEGYIVGLFFGVLLVGYGLPNLIALVRDWRASRLAKAVGSGPSS